MFKVNDVFRHWYFSTLPLFSLLMWSKRDLSSAEYQSQFRNPFESPIPCRGCSLTMELIFRPITLKHGITCGGNCSPEFYNVFYIIKFCGIFYSNKSSHTIPDNERSSISKHIVRKQHCHREQFALIFLLKIIFSQNPEGRESRGEEGAEGD